ncbi:hypothetical protein [Vibrio mexicanus]|uniref:hypothetical protein n=1 Tax=Vibrio mexicanus TaxID=1004326 RepID=UPI00063C6223|nr:hypothetical protein [Vibrio mexicanus]
MRKLLIAVSLIWPTISLASTQEVLDYFHQRGAENTKLVLSSDWFDCSEEDSVKVFCLDAFKYYQQDTFAMVEFASAKPYKLTLFSDFSHSSYSQLLLNLRRDGYELASVTRFNKTFNVKDQSANYSPEELDKAVIEFVNQGGASVETRMVWKLDSDLKSSVATFNSNGRQIELSFILHEKS